MNDLKSCIRDIPNFPKQGIIFKDITTLLKNGKKFREAVDLFAENLRRQRLFRQRTKTASSMRFAVTWLTNSFPRHPNRVEAEPIDMKTSFRKLD